jgi:hypothetical protein
MFLHLCFSKLRPQDMAKLSTILILLVMNLVVVGTTSAAIHLDLSNNSLTSVKHDELVPNSVFDSITKHYSGTDNIPISLTNNGNTIIYGGVLQFSGSDIVLHDVLGEAASLLVGDVNKNTNLTVKSISCDTLTIAAGSTLTIKAIGFNDSVTTPEPVSWIIWLLIGSIAVFYYRRHR